VISFIAATQHQQTGHHALTNRCLIFLLLLGCLASCAAPHTQVSSEISTLPVLYPQRAVMDDGYELPLTAWQPDGEPRAVVLALHGFNDYRNAFSGLGPHFAASEIITYAYDQRGFGETAQRGLWPGTEILQADAAAIAQLICQEYPDLPLFLLGESMGGAVVMDTMNEADETCVDGVILVAPAVWGWQTMPLWQQSALWLAAHVAPGYALTGEGVEITPSDNIEMLRALGRDPLVIKETRIDTVFGLTDLMESALLASSQLTIPTLILYGERDEIIPKRPICQMLGTLPGLHTRQWRLVLYPDGYHLLTRDLQAEVVLQDMTAWLHDQGAALPSDHELTVTNGAPRVQSLCDCL